MKENLTSRVIFEQIRNREYSTPEQFLALCKSLEMALVSEGRLFRGPWHRSERSSTTPPKEWNCRY